MYQIQPETGNITSDQIRFLQTTTQQQNILKDNLMFQSARLKISCDSNYF